MSTEKQDGNLDTGHDYDGIRELDNQLPNWWLWSFYLTIIFSIPYVFYYHVFNGPTLNQEYLREKEAIEYARALNKKDLPAHDEKTLLAAFANPEVRARGKQVFQSKCVSCHGAQGEGGIGPNLTDEYWLHGAKPLEIAKVVDEGVLDKGMPGWKAMMSPEEVQAAVAYVNSLRGTNPPGGKGPQGVKQ